MAQIQLSSDQQARIIINAANKWGIPWAVLLGVYGAETTFGSDVTTSSAGAVGPFQFIPSTAASHGYPMTNNPTMAQFTQQADAAAHLLSELYKQHGNNWDAALQSYSGGGYGLAHIKSVLQGISPGWLYALRSANAPGITGPGGVVGAIDTVGQGAVDTGKAVASGAVAAAQGIGNIAQLITSLDFWKRLGEALAGILLLAMGLRSLTGTATGPGTIVRSAAKVAKVAR